LLQLTRALKKITLLKFEKIKNNLIYAKVAHVQWYLIKLPNLAYIGLSLQVRAFSK
jgi:hypothetical protein